MSLTFAGAHHDLIGEWRDVIEICQVIDVVTLGFRSDRYQFGLSDTWPDTHRKHRHLRIQILNLIYANLDLQQT